MESNDAADNRIYFMNTNELEYTITKGDLGLLLFAWIDVVFDELDSYGRYREWRTPVIAFAQERLQCIAAVLGKRTVYETLTRQLRCNGLSEKGFRAFFLFWGGFPDLDPDRDDGDAGPLLC